jgi:hypothetical protein
MNPRLCGCVLSAMLAACGGPSEPPPSYAPAPAQHEAPDTLEITLRMSDGQPIDLVDYRGRRVLLYLFATFDLPSQAALAPLQEVAQQQPELAVIGVAMQPNAAELLPFFAAALNLEIALAYELDNRLLQGLTDLGPIEGVPTYVLLDSHGEPVRRFTGVMSAQALTQWCSED